MQTLVLLLCLNEYGIPLAGWFLRATSLMLMFMHFFLKRWGSLARIAWSSELRWASKLYCLHSSGACTPIITYRVYEHVCALQTIPSYSKVHTETVEVAALIELPAFPPVSRDCLLHPALLSLRYLMDANLPGEFAWKANKSQLRDLFIYLLSPPIRVHFVFLQLFFCQINFTGWFVK